MSLIWLPVVANRLVLSVVLTVTLAGWAWLALHTAIGPVLTSWKATKIKSS